MTVARTVLVAQNLEFVTALIPVDDARLALSHTTCVADAFAVEIDRLLDARFRMFVLDGRVRPLVGDHASLTESNMLRQSVERVGRSGFRSKTSEIEHVLTRVGMNKAHRFVQFGAQSALINEKHLRLQAKANRDESVLDKMFDGDSLMRGNRDG